MHQKLLLLPATLLLSLSILAQSPCQPILNQAEAALNSGDTEQALRKLQDVEICDDGNTLIRQRQRLQNAIFVKVDEQRLAADAALIQVEEEKTRTQTALNKTQKLVDAFYFYDDKFALAFKDNSFYFINKQGYKVEKLGEWRAAEQFGQHGYAQVSKTDRDRYLLDTMGQYLVPAQSLSELNRNTEIAIIKVSPDLVDSLIHSLNKSPNLKKLHLMVEVIGITGSAIAETAISPLFDAISKMRKLEHLDIRGSGLTFLPPSISQLSSLKYLDLSLNLIEEIPVEIGSLKRLEVLKLDRNQLNTFPEGLTALSNLSELSFRCDSISTLPATIGQLNKLKTLSFHCPDLIEFPKEFFELRSLKKLAIRGGTFTQLPAAIGQLDSLKYLDITQTQLSQIPIEIGQLARLETLRLMDNELLSIPPEIGQLSSLKHLLLRENQLTKLPEGIGRLANLESLDLSINQFEELNAAIGRLKELRILNTSWNPLRILPASIGQLSNLEQLNARNSLLKYLPAEIGQLQQLQQLELYSNQLANIPEELADLHQLKVLGLGRNNLTNFPLDVSNFLQLESLDLQANKLTKAPIGLEYVPYLTDLDLEDNLIPIDQLITLYGVLPGRVDMAGRTDYIRELEQNDDFSALYQLLASRTIHKEGNNNPRDWRDLSQYAFFAGEYDVAIRAAERTLELLGKNEHKKTILLLFFAYLLNDQWPDAEAILLKWKGRSFANDSHEAKKDFLEGIQELEEMGITHPDFAKVRAIFE